MIIYNSYFSQTFPILERDKSLYCVSAWNDLAPLHGSRNVDRVYRVESFMGYGWMLTRRYLDEILNKWVVGDHVSIKQKLDRQRFIVE